jgi:hypothetical protein
VSDADLRRCLDCDYPLRGLPEPRCPECGRPFDPADPNSYFAPPPKDYLSPRECLAMVGIPSLLCAVTAAVELVFTGAALIGLAVLVAFLTACGAAIESFRVLRDPEAEAREQYWLPLIVAVGVLLVLVLAILVLPLC